APVGGQRARRRAPCRPGAAEFRRARPQRHALTVGRIEAALTRLWWRERRTPLTWLLWPLSALYRLALALRAAAFAFGVRRAQCAPVPVIVVGNLVAGGAGKTPTVI